MNIRGPVVETSAPRTVETDGGSRALAEVVVRPERGAAEPATVTLWGDWAETADGLEPGTDLLVTDVATDEYRGEETYATTGDSFVVVAPDYLVNVTDVRQWVQCPRLEYLNGIEGVPLAEPVTTGTVVHEVFGDLLRGRDVEESVDHRLGEAALELGLLGADPEETRETVRRHARAIEGWLEQGALGVEDAWRSEVTLISPTFGMKGRADAIRRGMPVELKTGKNTNREPRFHDKVQATCYALLLRERGVRADTGTLLYTKNAALDRAEADGDLSPAKEFSIGYGLLAFVVRARNDLVTTALAERVPSGHEADAVCEYCFERDTCVVVAGRLGQESKAGPVGTAVPEHEREYVADWAGRIEAERRAVHREYAKLWEQSPDERAADGRAVVGLEPAGRERTEDRRWRLRATREGGAATKIRAGDTVLASEGDPVSGVAELARVERLTDDEAVVTAEEPLDLERLDVYPSELSVDRMQTAVHDAVLRSPERQKAVLFGDADPAFRDVEATVVETNPAQDRAVRRALAAEDLALVHGPPGTGKTYTIGRLVAELVARGDRVLLSAFTNRAVDNAVDAVLDEGVEGVLRMGTETGVREDLRHLLLDADEPAAAADRLRTAPVVAATTATCGSRVMRDQEFDTVVVDEASQLTEPDTLCAVNRADRVVLVGDHEQLPPVVRDDSMDRSLFARLVDDHPAAAVTLDRQYRMAQRIQAFSSREFYDGALRPATAAVAGRHVGDVADAEALPGPLDEAVSVHPVSGTTASQTDAEEAARVADIVGAYLDAGVDPGDVAVIAPFRAQAAELEGRLPDDVAADTVDRFQGSSAEVVVVSFVATGSLDGPLFEDHRRLNVALTRAKRSLCLVGDPAALESEPLYDRMLDWARG